MSENEVSAPIRAENDEIHVLVPNPAPLMDFLKKSERATPTFGILDDFFLDWESVHDPLRTF